MKTILIIFPDSHLAYSPTTLQLFKELNKSFLCKIFCFETYDYHKLKNENIIFSKRVFGAGRLIIILKSIFPRLFNYDIRFYYRRVQLGFHLLFNKYDEIIYVDPISIALSGFFYKKGTLLSLELTHNTTAFLKYLNKPISNIIIQNKARLNVYFKEINANPFFVQNAPVFNYLLTKKYKTKKENQLVFGGTATLGFGIKTCLNFIKCNEKYSLIIKGNIPSDVCKIIEEEFSKEVSRNRVILNNNYEDDEEYLINLSENYIGFAFYDTSFEEINNINYKTGPSGKMFKYFAAGVPVIANNLEGFKPIEEFKSGVLINELNEKAILKAIHEISSNYEFYRTNCFKAAKHFSFENAINSFIDALKQKHNLN
jgi:glycosyltransferase involved in cell wall biosynthesis